MMSNEIGYQKLMRDMQDLGLVSPYRGVQMEKLQMEMKEKTHMQPNPKLNMANVVGYQEAKADIRRHVLSRIGRTEGKSTKLSLKL